MAWLVAMRLRAFLHIRTRIFTIHSLICRHRVATCVTVVCARKLLHTGHISTSPIVVVWAYLTHGGHDVRLQLLPWLRPLLLLLLWPLMALATTNPIATNWHQKNVSPCTRVTSEKPQQNNDKRVLLRERVHGANRSLNWLQTNPNREEN